MMHAQTVIGVIAHNQIDQPVNAKCGVASRGVYSHCKDQLISHINSDSMTKLNDDIPGDSAGPGLTSKAWKTGAFSR